VLAVVLDPALIFAAICVDDLGVAIGDVVAPDAVEFGAVGEPHNATALAHAAYVATAIDLAAFELDLEVAIGLAVLPGATEGLACFVDEHALAVEDIVLPLAVVPVASRIDVNTLACFAALLEATFVELPIREEERS
jgi:hypothetical protein